MSAEQIWNDVRAQRERPVFKRVDERHPYDLYLGVDVNESPVLMLLSASLGRATPETKIPRSIPKSSPRRTICHSDQSFYTRSSSPFLLCLRRPH